MALVQGRAGRAIVQQGRAVRLLMLFRSEINRQAPVWTLRLKLVIAFFLPSFCVGLQDWEYALGTFHPTAVSKTPSLVRSFSFSNTPKKEIALRIFLLLSDLFCGFF